MNKRIFSGILVTALILLVCVGCGSKKKDKETTAAPTTEATSETTEKETTEEASTKLATTEKLTTEDEKHKGLVQSDLTGEWITPEENAKRPIGVMINNIDVCWPHSGIDKADIAYAMT